MFGVHVYVCLFLFSLSLLSGVDIYSPFTPGPVVGAPVASACGTFNCSPPLVWRRYLYLFCFFPLLSGADIYSRFTPGLVAGACGTL